MDFRYTTQRFLQNGWCTDMNVEIENGIPMIDYDEATIKQRHTIRTMIRNGANWNTKTSVQVAKWANIHNMNPVEVAGCYNYIATKFDMYLISYDNAMKVRCFEDPFGDMTYEVE